MGCVKQPRLSNQQIGWCGMGRDGGARASLRELLGLLRGNGRLLAAAIVVSLLGAAASLLLPIIVNQLVKQVGSSGDPTGTTTGKIA
jgi:hypothetical protein